MICRLLAITLALVFISGCTNVPDEAQYSGENPKDNLYIIEFNDKGGVHKQCFGGSKPCRYLETFHKGIESSQIRENVIVFAHGWHHNAEPNDKNLDTFRTFINRLNARTPQYTGIYLAWRGDSSDVIFTDKTDFEALDFYTLWNRNSVAAHIGKNGANKFFDMLTSYQKEGKIRNIIGIGHSMGGRLVYFANKERIKEPNNNTFFLLINPALTDEDMKEVLMYDVKKINNFPRTIVVQSESDIPITFGYDLIHPGDESVGDSWAITHDLNACQNNNDKCLSCLKAKSNGENP
ncbi:hypothetical protein [Pseudoalteromonas luteoviolacea]|uniref:Alpha/beta hydrolase n=1 Tax=Pseudoalteromonas luteoviolacea (strain 2ta16) TaxID=1353533 RepID=V4HYV7_PSEL2|nr:hypothetical protein [Pseudoalteromonas luteoviolacea]ESP94973.1 hypothetical protein PL2TA16_04529 [Pseudoalteromonas luteoviolacea 2ta16]KZN36304.1 hypothetical protein N483_22600 [Pseudoalteromonas luteoviolacea NCIMB 1944]